MKSIYGKIQQNTLINIQPSSIIQYGFENSRCIIILNPVLRESSNMVQLVRSKNFKQLIEILKLTAAKNNVNSLSMCQMHSLLKCFCIYKKLELSWFNTSDETVNPDDYEIFINPIITGTTDVNYYIYIDILF